MSLLSGSRIVLGVTGGIAAYKAADLASKLVQAGATVDVVMTEAATRLVGETTFQALTKRPVHTGVFEAWSDDWFGHISLGHAADAIVVAPATANSIAKLAHGLGDDMLGAVALSTTAPLLIAPAMEHDMFRHPATLANLTTLRARGATVVGPESGRLASGEMGEGRMSSPETIVGALRRLLGRTGPLAGKRMVVTAGGTREPLDPIRYLGNRSSGRMGHALAQAAIDAGADVELITTATSMPIPVGAELTRVETAQEMFDAVQRSVVHADILAMSAAVADFRPAEAKRTKIKKQPGAEGLPLDLVRNPDIIASVSKPGLVKVGFAAETDGLIEYAQGKLVSKGLDMIVANDAESTIGQAESTAVLLFAPGDPIELPRMPKADVAARIVAEIVRIVEDRARR
ncbi:MAG: bifunctional phosphopantothenoylcysteine decarboxylase/phosphopantothenate--cysteine ligase CoaBC [Thermomicrobiales bacterium]|nr:bifunctional phosphopantothenoylcysteine decarboxylase/phosphopantothenate--cysteine ligase CoaBC [Thermomicrobiales bacterium]